MMLKTMLCALALTIILSVRRVLEDRIRYGRKRTLEEIADIIFPRSAKRGFKKVMEERKKNGD